MIGFPSVNSASEPPVKSGMPLGHAVEAFTGASLFRQSFTGPCTAAIFTHEFFGFRPAAKPGG